MSTKESELCLFEIDSVNDRSSDAGSNGSFTAHNPQKIEIELGSVDVQHEHEDKPKPTGIQQRGRFKVTTSHENVDLDKVMSNHPF
jgi:hypothetical protein